MAHGDEALMRFIQKIFDVENYDDKCASYSGITDVPWGREPWPYEMRIWNKGKGTMSAATISFNHSCNVAKYSKKKTQIPIFLLGLLICVCATICLTFVVQRENKKNNNNNNNNNNLSNELSVTQGGKGSGIVHRTNPSWENCSQPGILYSDLKKIWVDRGINHVRWMV